MTREQERQEKISKLTGIPLNQVVLANRSVFEFIREEIESGRRKPIRWWKVGLFNCKPERVRKLQEKGMIYD